MPNFLNISKNLPGGPWRSFKELLEAPQGLIYASEAPGGPWRPLEVPWGPSNKENYGINEYVISTSFLMFMKLIYLVEKM